jgi:hypothetical protein
VSAIPPWYYRRFIARVIPPAPAMASPTSTNPATSPPVTGSVSCVVVSDTLSATAVVCTSGRAPALDGEDVVVVPASVVEGAVVAPPVTVVVG